MKNSNINILAEIISNILYQLEISDEDQINSDYAVSLIEMVSSNLQEIRGEDLDIFLRAIKAIEEKETDIPKKIYLSEFGPNFGIS